MDWPLLKRVSRSFYITLRLLPAEVRESIALAYLLARITDTEADGAESDAERELLARKAEWIGELDASPDRGLIEEVWGTIQEGQRFDGERFGSAAAPLNREELDRYTYLVAGCVGEFWTKICARRIPGFAGASIERMTDWGVRFGKGLQLVNILRDRAADARRGRVYVPQGEIGEVARIARGHLAAAGEYVDSLKIARLRIACALPLLLGRETLDLIEKNPTAERVKVERGRVWLLLFNALLAEVPFWKRSFR